MSKMLKDFRMFLRLLERRDRGDTPAYLEDRTYFGLRPSAALPFTPTLPPPPGCRLRTLLPTLAPRPPTTRRHCEHRARNVKYNLYLIE